MPLHLTTGGLLIVLAGAFSAFLALYTLSRNPESWSHRFFAAGMALLALETLLGGKALLWSAPGDMALWFRVRMAVSALVPGTWLVFALVLGERVPQERLGKWKGTVLAVFLLPFLAAVPFSRAFFAGEPHISASGDPVLLLGWSGFAFHLLFTLALVLLMVTLETTLRSSKGIKRWQVKFLVLGILGYFFVRIYSSSQAILFRSLDAGMETTLAAAALVLADLLMTVTFVRTRVLPGDIYLSGEIIKRSVVLLLVGGYLLAAGLLAKALTILGGPLSYQQVSFLVFAALLLLAALLFSNRLRFTLSALVSRHFKRPRYDYRETWMSFTRKTAASENVRDLASRTASLISEMLEVLSVGIWLFGEGRGELRLCGSTTHSGSPTVETGRAREVEPLKTLLKSRREPFDLDNGNDRALKEYRAAHEAFLDQIRMRYCAPLWAGGDLLGLVAVDNRVLDVPFGTEEFDLLGTIAAQAATTIRRMLLSEQLQASREMETLRKFSAFFVHDLKNLASKLSMMLQNFPEHYDDPQFREDALKLIAQSVEKINSMGSRVSDLREEPEAGAGTGDLPRVVRESVAEFDPPAGVSILEEYEETPHSACSEAQVSRVVTNLVLNALESLDGAGRIRVRTYEKDGWAVIEVGDDGRGMDEEFITESLFRPFQTTKEDGLGIGMYQSRTLVEAQGGRIEVSSEPGKGATFTVFLPALPGGAEGKH